VALREYVFKTASGTNPLCRWTRTDPERWILVQLLRPNARARSEGAVFTLHAPDEADIDTFLRDEFGRRYGTFDVIQRRPQLVSVEVSNLLLPAYRGVDPVQMTTNMLGPDAFFAPLLVQGGYIHVRVYAAPPEDGRNFAELLKRFTATANPEDFQLIHTGEWDPVTHLRPRADRLTDRQQEILRVAVQFGYYDEPRRCTLEEIATAFGVSKAAVHKHLVAAESKIIKGHRS
jgi:hypothetical protein